MKNHKKHTSQLSQSIKEEDRKQLSKSNLKATVTNCHYPESLLLLEREHTKCINQSWEL
jgi:hypothetical protein